MHLLTTLLGCGPLALRCACCLLAGLIIYGYQPIRRWRYRKLPGPPPRWLVGNLGPIIKLGYPKALQQWAEQYGPVFKIWQGGNVLVVVEDPAAARSANLHSHDRPPIFFNFVGEERRFDDAGMLLAKGDKYWQSLKHAWQAMFHPSSLRAYAGMMNASARQLAAVLDQKAETGEEVEIWRLFGCLTMEVVGSTAFGLELQTVKKHAEVAAMDVSTTSFDLADSDATRLLKSLAVQFAFAGPADSLYALCSLLFPDAALVFRFLGTYLPDKGLRRQLQARQQMRAVCYKLISQARQHSNSSSRNDSLAHRSDDGWEVMPPHPTSPPPGGFISHLLSSENKLIGRRFTDTEVAAQAFTFIMGGYETTASMLAFAVHFIAQHQHVEAKLLAEVDAFGRTAGTSYDDCDRFPYLEAVLNETLRLLPPISLGTIREARTAMQLRGYDIPKGAYMNAAIFSFQNSDKYWEDAQAFKPERFLAQTDKSDRASALPAFCAFGDVGLAQHAMWKSIARTAALQLGHPPELGFKCQQCVQGRRACVGVKFAKANAKIALIWLYQRFTLKLTPGQLPLAVHTNLTMAPTHGVKVLVLRRP